jgi:hypothetical protein
MGGHANENENEMVARQNLGVALTQIMIWVVSGAGGDSGATAP